MNRRLSCGCRWVGGAAYVCPVADGLQRAVEAAQLLRNVVILAEAEQALVGHWRAGGLSRRDFDVLMQRAKD